MDKATLEQCKELLKKAKECGVDLNEWMDPNLLQIKARLTVHVPVTFYYTQGTANYVRDEKYGTGKLRTGLAYLRELLTTVRPHSTQTDLCDETEKLLDLLEKQYLQ